MTILNRINSSTIHVNDIYKWGTLKAQHSITLKYNGMKRSFSFYCGLTSKPTKEDLIFSLMMDFDCTNLKAMEELGYDIIDEREEACNIIQQIKNNNFKLLEMFTPREIKELKTIAENF